jgi:hypothetical protein
MKPASAAFVGLYWGKALPTLAEGPSWHPLAYHGALANASGLPVDVARRWLIVNSRKRMVPAIGSDYRHYRQ